MEYDLVIIGSGPAGYVAAIRAGQVGLKTVIIEKSKIGGMCLNWGCIPTKVLLENAKKLVAVKKAAIFGIDGIDENKLTFNWKTAVNRSDRIVKRLSKGVEYLLKKNSVEIITGEAEIVSQHSVSVKNRLLETKNIMIATGSRPETPGYPVPEGTIIELEDLLNLEALPQKPLVLGDGPHAVELTHFFKLIDKDVKLLVPGNSFLSGVDPYLVDYIKQRFKKSKIEILFFSILEGNQMGKITVDEKEIQCDRLINASRRRAVIPPSRIELSLEKDLDFIPVNDFLQTNVNNIYAVGDVNGRSSLAHAASAQGLHAVNVISGIKEKISMEGIPMNIYTYPEIAQVGYTEPAIKAQGLDYKISEFPLSANGKALAEGQTEGLVRIISEKKYGEVVGVQIIAEHATDMIAEASSVIQLEGTVFDVAHTIHAHPTISEVFMEAGFAAFDQPIHK